MPAPAPIELLVPPRLLPEPLDDPIVVLPGLDELLLSLGLDDAVLLAPGLLLEPYVPLDAEGLLLEPIPPELPAEPMVVEPLESEPMELLPGVADALALLPRLRQGVVPALEAPMPLVLGLVLELVPAPVLGLVLDPLLNPVPELDEEPVDELVLLPGLVLDPLEEDCACTANEAAASAALAARTAILWVLVMSEVLLVEVRSKTRRDAAHGMPAMGRIPQDRGNGCARQEARAGRISLARGR
ncbi:hypothetical protein ACPWT1_18315 [Ramlibacter sp. MMS24-I3-19]|uniref:hypothetical protein n=1 Tax=Ramlibacter sp. MMS24-I3-19 TaxID=3416606 RepID=UPI003CFFD434